MPSGSEPSRDHVGTVTVSSDANARSTTTEDEPDGTTAKKRQGSQVSNAELARLSAQRTVHVQVEVAQREAAIKCHFQRPDILAANLLDKALQDSSHQACRHPASHGRGYSARQFGVCLVTGELGRARARRNASRRTRECVGRRTF